MIGALHLARGLTILLNPASDQLPDRVTIRFRRPDGDVMDLCMNLAQATADPYDDPVVTLLSKAGYEPLLVSYDE